jgi:hypothetical protein
VVTTSDRGQLYTLEAFAAALLLLAGIGLAIQAAGVTALSSGAADSEVRTGVTGLAEGSLDAAVANDSLRPAVLHWDPAAERFHGASSKGYYTTSQPTAFGGTLDRTLGARGIAFNVNVRYLTPTGDHRRQRVITAGTPDTDAVRAVRTVTLLDDDRLRDASGAPTDSTLADSAFYAPDAAPDSAVYNVVRVEVIAWRT